MASYKHVDLKQSRSKCYSEGISKDTREKVNLRKSLTTLKSLMGQGFIQALWLTSVFHEGLSFMALGRNPTYISMLTIATRGSYRAQ